MYTKIAEIDISNDERLYGTLIKDLEKEGYLVVEDSRLRSHYIIAKKQEDTVKQSKDNLEED